MAPVIWWVRKDLRVSDNPALEDAIATGGPVFPVFILDEVFEDYGAAPLWRFGLGVEKLAETLKGKGSRLILRRGKAKDVLAKLVEEIVAGAVRWSRAYDPDQVARDKAVKSHLQDKGIDAKSIADHLLFEQIREPVEGETVHREGQAAVRALEGQCDDRKHWPVQEHHEHDEKDRQQVEPETAPGIAGHGRSPTIPCGR